MLNGKHLLYGVMQDELYFMPAELARKFARIRHAVENSSTWGELKKLVKRSEFLELKEQYENAFGDEEKLTSGTEIEPDFLDEDYYEHPAKYMQEWLPDDIIAKYGKAGMSMMDGILINFEPADEEAIVMELVSRGYTCERKQDLLAFAMGEYCETIPVHEFQLSREKDNKPKQATAVPKIEIIGSDSVEIKNQKPSKKGAKKKSTGKSVAKKAAAKKPSAGKARRIKTRVVRKTKSAGGKKKK